MKRGGAPAYGPDWPLLTAMGGAGVIVAIVFGVLGAASLVAGESPVLSPAATSLAEAAGNRDAAEVVWRISSGEDLAAAADVQIPLKLVGRAHLTPLEAAVLSEWTPMIRLLIDAGALRNRDTLPRLRCIAQRERDRDTIVYLASIDGNRPVDCGGVELPAYVRAPQR